MRSLLTVLGIVIGISAVITLVTLGNGATLAIQNQISNLGTNLLLVRPGQRIGGRVGAPAFTMEDAEAIASQIGGVAAVAPEARASVSLIANGKSRTGNIAGSNNDWLFAGNWTLTEGRVFSESELRGGFASCLIGETVRRELFATKSAMGEQLRVKQVSCEIVGILASKGQGSFGYDQDDIVLMPIKTVQRRLTGLTRIYTILVSLNDGSDGAHVAASINKLLRERRKLTEGEDDNFNILDTKQLADTLASTTKLLTALLGAVAAVSLLVGGIGVMNIMLVSVTERTREIGLRLAIGAMGREVMLQFLIEAIVLAAMGGVVGIILATVASIGLAHLMDVPYHFDLWVNVSSLLFSAGIGVLFGFVPARRAARLDPIEALRHE